MNIRRYIEERLAEPLSKLAGRSVPAIVAPSARAGFGDYQANGVMPAAKSAGTSPRKLAEQLLATANLAGVAEKLDIAGPGFINIRLDRAWLQQQLSAMAADEHLGVDRPVQPQTVVVDYSAPNLAKEMHVGHLRSTIIGDALARTLGFVGHKVIRQNHVGDWGTQFGMLLAYLKLQRPDWQSGGIHIADLEDFYRQAKQLFDADPAFADAARAEVVALQGGNPDSRRAWEMFLDESMEHCRAVYKTLGVLLADSDVHGESAYNDDLANVVADLDKAGLLKESQGAKCVFLPEFADKDGDITPVIVQKSDGGYLYATTDLAAIRYRVGTLKAQRVLYLTDGGQALHFRMVFAAARQAGMVPEDVRLEHVPFGVMLAEGGGKFRTRTGGTVKLIDLLDEAQKRARAIVLAKNPELTAEADEVAQIVGIGAVKYADLSQNRNSDYVFSFEKMLAMEGNTAPYMQYAYARISSIFRKAGVARESFFGRAVELAQPEERALGLKLLQFAETIQAVASECLPNLLCAYLYDLAGAFTGFYENCPVIQADEPTRTNRLALCALTARTMQKGLSLLGIRTIEQM